MKIPLIAATLMVMSAPAFAGDLSVSIGVNEPGFYGQINIGDYPRPSVVYAQPMIIERGPRYVEAEPMYLHVPPGHEKHWKQHCAEYQACGRRVYFVQDGWYRNEYARRHEGRGQERREDRRDDRGHGKGHDKGHGHGHDDDQRGGGRDD